ncbi:hypothetical protein LCGC14_1706590 [marine sediment metagenome]|uniref:Uncharacterized protein n=1 Tax=marine sediment metagenome TaxID=412755 RepID=A0A0F9I420_9ZZZZ
MAWEQIWQGVVIANISMLAAAVATAIILVTYKIIKR